MKQHSCIKCGVKYEDSDVDDFYCPTCTIEKNAIAAEIDKKMAGRVSDKGTPGPFSEKDFVGPNGRIMFDANGMRI